MEPIFFEPVLQEKIWGGSKLGLYFNLPITSYQTGEAWLISAHPNGISKVISPQQYAGMGLDDLYQQHTELFGDKVSEKFPLLTKLIDASEKLSVQVHPDDEYALAHEGEFGKTECWYVVSAAPGSKIVYGHIAETLEEFEDKVENGEWENLLTEVEVADGDFFYVPSGTLHAIGAGVVIMEIQQNSDTTYRVFDYDRRDEDGNARELHLDKAMDVTNIPHRVPQLNITQEVQDGGQIIHYLTTEYFSVYKWDLKKELSVKLLPTYYLATVITGEGELIIDGREYPLTLADSFILPVGISNLTLRGDLEIIVTHPQVIK